MICTIFDLDGTLLYTLEDLWISTNFALGAMGYKKRTLEEVKTFVGNGVKKLIERSLPENTSEDEVQKCLNIFREHYSKNANKHTRPYDGIIELLKYLKKNNVKIAVNSNKYDAAVKKLCREYFCELIDIAVGEMPSCPKKPSPEGVNKILKYFDCDLYHAVYIGDSLVDLQTAKNAGIECISVSWGYCPREELLRHKAKIADNSGQLLALLDEFVARVSA